MKNKPTSFVIGRVGVPSPQAPTPTGTDTPLVDRLLQSAANAEQLLERGTVLSGRSREEILAILDKTPIITD